MGVTHETRLIYGGDPKNLVCVLLLHVYKFHNNNNNNNNNKND